MCGGGGGFGWYINVPNAVGQLLYTLCKGDQVVIKAGHGCPPVAVDTYDVIYDRPEGQFGALTAGGIILSCRTVRPGGVEKTGVHLEKFEVTKEADELLAEARLARELMQAELDELE